MHFPIKEEFHFNHNSSDHTAHIIREKVLTDYDNIFFPAGAVMCYKT